MKNFSILIFVALVALTGCKPKETTLSGQMFIVTQGGENIKLGDVRIILVEKSQVADFLQKKAPVIKSELIARKAEYDAAKEEAQKIVDDDRQTQALNSQELSATADREYASINRFKNARAKYLNFPMAEDWLTDFSPIVFRETLTDADGNFSITYPRNKNLAIFAKAERTTLTDTEKYYWVIDAPTNAPTVQIFLSNDNLASTASALSTYLK